MADIGVLPTKTTIRISSSTGDHGTIEAATPKQAGVMSAEQANQLATLWGRVEGDGGGVVVLPAPARVDGVSRADLGNALAQLRTGLMGEVGQVLAALRDQAMTSGAAPVSIDAARVERLELAVVALGERMDALEKRFGEIGAAFDLALTEKAA